MLPVHPILQLPYLPHSLILTHHWAGHHQTTRRLHRHAHQRACNSGRPNNDHTCFSDERQGWNDGVCFCVLVTRWNLVGCARKQQSPLRLLATMSAQIDRELHDVLWCVLSLPTLVPQLLQHGNCTPGVRYSLPYGATRTPREIWLLVPPFPNTTVRPWFRHLHLWFRTILLICSLLLLLLVHFGVCYVMR